MREFNYSKLRNSKWDSEILGLVAQIHEFKGRQELYLKQKPATLDKLIEIAKVQSTEASNKIEGIVTTSTRVQQLCNEKTSIPILPKSPTSPAYLFCMPSSPQ